MNSQNISCALKLHFSIRCDVLLKSLKRVIHVIESRQLIPILSHIKLDIQEKSIKLTATDCKMELISYADLSQAVSSPIHITLPGRKLMDICRTLSADVEINFEIKKDWVTLSAGSLIFTLATLPSESFPSIKLDDDKVQSFSIDEADFYYLLSRTHFAMAEQDVRYFLNGILLEVDGHKIKTVATDGHRLACNTHIQKTELKSILKIILTRKSAIELMRLFKDTEASLKFLVSSNHARIIHPEFTLTTTLLHGSYPNYEQALIPERPNRVKINKAGFKDALMRAKILVNERFNEVSLKMAGEEMTVSSCNEQQEVCKETLSIIYDGEEVAIKFNVNYLLDVLNIFEVADLYLSFGLPQQGVYVEEPNNKQSLFVIMPITT